MKKWKLYVDSGTLKVACQESRKTQSEMMACGTGASPSSDSSSSELLMITSIRDYGRKQSHENVFDFLNEFHLFCQLF